MALVVGVPVRHELDVDWTWHEQLMLCRDHIDMEEVARALDRAESPHSVLVGHFGRLDPAVLHLLGHPSHEGAVSLARICPMSMISVRVAIDVLHVLRAYAESLLADEHRNA